jgi:uracil-DNA glycosylase
MSLSSLADKFLMECRGCEICRIEEQPLPSWRRVLKEEFEKGYYRGIVRHLHQEKFLPPAQLVLRFLTFFEMDACRVVILGQDPYHGEGQAMGLAFSVPSGVVSPPSLVNIKKEVYSSTGKRSMCKDGSLVKWAEQGVLLMNATLTVVKSRARSHAHLGWRHFTNRVIEVISERNENVVFILWGNDARSKAELIDTRKHLVLKGVHPSPLSANKGFFGSNHFALANEYLVGHGKKPIEW